MSNYTKEIANFNGTYEDFLPLLENVLVGGKLLDTRISNCTIREIPPTVKFILNTLNKRKGQKYFFLDIEIDDSHIENCKLTRSNLPRVMFVLDNILQGGKQ